MENLPVETAAPVQDILCHSALISEFPVAAALGEMVEYAQPLAPVPVVSTGEDNVVVSSGVVDSVLAGNELSSLEAAKSINAQSLFCQDLERYSKPMETDKSSTSPAVINVAKRKKTPARVTPSASSKRLKLVMKSKISPASSTPKIQREASLQQFLALLENLHEEYTQYSGDAPDVGAKFIVQHDERLQLRGDTIVELLKLLSLCTVTELIDFVKYRDSLRSLVDLCLNRIESSGSIKTLKGACSDVPDDGASVFFSALNNSMDVLAVCHLLLRLLQCRSPDQYPISSHHSTSIIIEDNDLKVILTAVRDHIGGTLLYSLNMPGSKLPGGQENSDVEFLTLMKQNPNWKSIMVNVAQNSFAVLTAIYVLMNFDSNPFTNDDLLFSLAFSGVEIVISEFTPSSNSDFEKGDLPSSFLAVMYNEVQMAGVQILRCIFSRYPQHRFFLIDEILTNLIKLPSIQNGAQKKAAVDESGEFDSYGTAWGGIFGSKQAGTVSECSSYRLSEGKTIHICTALFLQFAQSIVEHDMRQWVRQSTTADENVQLSESFLAFSSETLDAITALASYIFSYLMNKTMMKVGVDESKGLSPEYRMIFDGIVGDLLHSLAAIEFPISVLFVQVLAFKLVAFLEVGFPATESSEPKTVKYGVTTYNMATEYMSWIFSRVLKIQKKSKDLAAKSVSAREPDDIFWDASHDKRLLKLDIIFDYLDATQSTMEEHRSAKTVHAMLWQRHQLSIPESQVSIDRLCKGFIVKTRFNLAEQSEIQLAAFEVISKEHLFSEKALNAFTMRLLSMLTDPNISYRTRALRSLILLTKCGASLGEVDSLNQAGAICLHDNSASVRELAVDLISLMLKQGSSLCIRDSFNQLAPRILDTATSVRKRTIRSFRDLYLDVSIDDKSLSFHLDICSKIINRLVRDPEESVRALAARSLREIWMSNVSFPLSVDFPSKISNDSNVVVSALQNVSYNALDEVSKANIANNLKAFALLSHEPTALKALLDFSSNKTYWPIVAVLKIFADLSIAENTGEALATCALISDSVPSLFAKHIDLLAENIYKLSLSSDLDARDLVQNSIRIVNNTVACSALEASSFIWGPVEVDQGMILSLNVKLANLSSKLDSASTEICVMCVATIEEKLQAKPETSLLKQILVKCLSYINSFRKALPETSNIASLGRALFIAGAALKYRNCPDDADLLPLAQEYFSQFATATSVNENIRKTAVASLGCIWRTHPYLMISEECLTIVDGLLAADSESTEIKIQIFAVMCAYLREESCRVQEAKDSNGKKNSSISLHGDAAQHSESSISSSLMQRYFTQILDSSLSLNAEMRKIAYDLIYLIVGSGLVHPLQCLPNIIALESFEEESQRNSIMNLHTELREKYNSFIHNRNVDGIKLSFQWYQKLTQLTPQQLERSRICIAKDGEVPLSHLYSIVKSKKQSRRAFISTLTQFFDTSAFTMGDDRSNIQFSLYIASNIAGLQFKYIEEPLIVISILGRILSSSAFEVQLHLKTPDDTAITTDTYASAIINMIAVNLKIFLQTAYQISDSRCLAFDMADLSKASEKPVNRREIPPFNVPSEFIQQPSNLDILLVDKSDVAKSILTQEYDKAVAALEDFSLTFDEYEQSTTPSKAHIPSTKTKPSPSTCEKTPASVSKGQGKRKKITSNAKIPVKAPAANPTPVQTSRRISDRTSDRPNYQDISTDDEDSTDNIP